MNRRILIVDDVPAMRALLKGILHEHTLLEAGTGQRAIELMNDKEPPELVLLDMSLDDKNGLQVLKETENIRREKNIKVCFVTGHRDRETVVKSLALGANDYVVKPVDIMSLKGKIDAIFGSQAEQFVTIKTRLSAQIKDVPLDVDLMITELSEAGLAFSCNLNFQTGKNIVLESATLNEKFQMQGTLVRIDSVTRLKGGFSYKASFVGLAEVTAQKIRSCTQRQAELQDEIVRESQF